MQPQKKAVGDIRECPHYRDGQQVVLEHLDGRRNGFVLVPVEVLDSEAEVSPTAPEPATTLVGVTVSSRAVDDPSLVPCRVELPETQAGVGQMIDGDDPWPPWRRVDEAPSKTLETRQPPTACWVLPMNAVMAEVACRRCSVRASGPRKGSSSKQYEWAGTAAVVRPVHIPDVQEAVRQMTMSRDDDGDDDALWSTAEGGHGSSMGGALHRAYMNRVESWGVPVAEVVERVYCLSRARWKTAHD